MRMITVKINGHEVEADLLNPIITKKVEDGFDAVLKKYNEATMCRRGSEGIQAQCEAVIDYVADIFGTEAARKIFGEEADLLTCMDVLEEMQDVYPGQVNPIIKKRAAMLAQRLGASAEDKGDDLR